MKQCGRFDVYDECHFSRHHASFSYIGDTGIQGIFGNITEWWIKKQLVRLQATLSGTEAA